MTPEELSHACWRKALPVSELILLLDDDRDWKFGGYVSFDGDASTTVVYVSQSAVGALAAIAPGDAPIDKVVATVLRLQGRICEINTCTWAPPQEVPLRWSARDLHPFGEPLVAALRAALEDRDPDTQRRAAEVLRDLTGGR
jgi:hypothetical protein